MRKINDRAGVEKEIKWKRRQKTMRRKVKKRKAKRRNEKCKTKAVKML